jgi:hypothetical protein
VSRTKLHVRVGRALRCWLFVAVAAVAAVAAVTSSASAVPPGGDPDEFNLRLAIVIEGEPNPCNGELISASGFMHLLSSANLAPTGNFENYSLTDFQATGTGSLGNSYVLTYAGPSSESYTFAAPGDEYGSRQTYVQEYNVIALGPAPDYHATYLIHITVTDGEPTATVENVESRCTG